jgi:hypothetical protein
LNLDFSHELLHPLTRTVAVFTAVVAVTLEQILKSGEYASLSQPARILGATRLHGQRN